MADYLSLLKNSGQALGQAFQVGGNNFFYDKPSTGIPSGWYSSENWQDPNSWTSLPGDPRTSETRSYQGANQGNLSSSGGGGNIFDLPTLTPESATTTSSSGFNWNAPELTGLLDQIKNWTQKTSGLAENSLPMITNFYTNLMNQALGPQAFQGTLNNLRQRNMLDSTVASDALAKVGSNIAGEIGNTGLDRYLKSVDMQAQMPGLLAQLANIIGEKTSTTNDPMAAYNLIFGNYV